MRPATFWASVVVAIAAPLASLRYWLWLPVVDAPEVVGPVIAASIVGAIVFLAAVALAWLTRPTSSP